MKKKIIIGCVVLSLGALACCSFKGWGSYCGLKSRYSRLEKRKITWKILDGQIREASLDFNGEVGIFIKDLTSNWQIGINQDRLFPSASLVKIPIMAACFSAANEGKIKLNEVLIFKAQDRSLGSGKLKEAPTGTKLSINKLIELMISESDNTAANMLIKRLGFDYLNSCFKRLRLNNTNICREMMDFKSRKAGRENFTTVSDLVSLLERIYHGRLINKFYSKMCLEYLKKQKIRDRIPAKLPPDTEIAHKTGLERGLCHDAGIVFVPGGDFLICVLTKHHHKTAKLAKEFIAQIALKTYNYYRNL
jgi:beta-lactamase class A